MHWRKLVIKQSNIIFHSIDKKTHFNFWELVDEIFSLNQFFSQMLLQWWSRGFRGSLVWFICRILSSRLQKWFRPSRWLNLHHLSYTLTRCHHLSPPRYTTELLPYLSHLIHRSTYFPRSSKHERIFLHSYRK